MVSTQMSGTSHKQRCGSQQESEDTGMRRQTAPASPALKRLGSMDAEAECGLSGLQLDVCGAAHGGVLEGQLLHQEVNTRVHLKAMQVVCVSLQPHEQSPVGHIGRAETGGEEQ